MNSSSKPERGTIGAANALQLQSSQPHLKRFIMFDHSGGKGRVFFHPALAQELFGSSQVPKCDTMDIIPEKGSNIKLFAYKQMVEGAFTSLQALRASRQSDMLYVQQPTAAPLLPGVLASSQKPRVFETIARDGISWALDDQAAAQRCLASKPLVCEEQAKVPAIPPSTESLRDCKDLASLFSSSSSMKKSDVAAASESMQENTEDLDALLSSDEDEDDDVRSTGHSPDESTCKGEVCSEDEEEEVEQLPNKRRKIGEKYPNESRPKGMSAGEEANDKGSFLCNRVGIQANRRQKIKRTVKALRKMIPGGALLDAALVLDETIMYVKTLRDRVNQLEATRLQSHHYP